jgi:hypothetical protein
LRKLKANNRWNAWWDGMIGATLQNPKVVDVQGTAKVYKTECSSSATRFTDLSW